MSHFGILCPPAVGHLHPLSALGHELQQRGHQVTVFGLIDIQTTVEQAQLGFQGVGEHEFPKGTLQASLTEGVQSNPTKWGMGSWIEVLSSCHLTHGLEVMQSSQLDVLITDPSSPEGGTLAEKLDIPFASVFCGLITIPEETIPPPATTWPYAKDLKSRQRNLAAYETLQTRRDPVKKLLNHYRQRWNLPEYTLLFRDELSPLAQLSQLPPAFEYPRDQLPDWFHFTGPLLNPALRPTPDFPYDQLDGRPLIYASLGTVHNRRPRIFRTIAKVCDSLNLQLVMSLGWGIPAEKAVGLPGHPIVVDFAPQSDLIQRAALVINNGGLNTVLECLSHGVPVLAIPTGFDNPGISARLAWTGAGEFILPTEVTPPRLKQMLQQMLRLRSYKHQAEALQEQIRQSGGSQLAATLVEKVL